MTKTVTYFKQHVEVPTHTRYIATDGNGEVYAYANRPIPTAWETWTVYDYQHNEVAQRVGYRSDLTEKWQSSLVDLNAQPASHTRTDRTVSYHGQLFTVQDSDRYIAVNADGEVNTFTDVPYPYTDDDELYWHDGGAGASVGHLDVGKLNINWQFSLSNVNDLKHLPPITVEPTLARTKLVNYLGTLVAVPEETTRLCYDSQESAVIAYENGVPLGRVANITVHGKIADNELLTMEV